MMDNARMNEIAEHARQAAMRANAGWAVPRSAPNSYTNEEAEFWLGRFARALRGEV